MFKIAVSILSLALAMVSQQAEANLCKAKFLPKILVISGTDRPGSTTLKITRQVEELAKAKGHDVKVIDLQDLNLAELKGDYFNPTSNFQTNFISKMTEADAVLFVFPEYNGSFPGILKLFLDYSPLKTVLGGKPVGMISDADGKLGGQKGAEALAGIMHHVKADVIGSALVLIPDVNANIKDDRISDTSIVQRIEDSVQSLIKRASANLNYKE